jgi:hypothetical protein
MNKIRVRHGDSLTFHHQDTKTQSFGKINKNDGGSLTQPRGKKCFTSSLIPAFSPRRRRIVRRLFEKPATGLAGGLPIIHKRAMAVPSPGGEGWDEGERQNKLFILLSDAGDAS